MQYFNNCNTLEEVKHLYKQLTGNTYAVKAELKAAKFDYAHKKKCWYFRTEEFKARGGKKSLDEIRSKYGSTTVNGKYAGNALNK